MTLVGRNVWFFMTEKPGPHTFAEKLLPVSARKRHFHDNDIWLQRLKFISFLLLTLSCRSCWGLKTIVLIFARNNKLKNILVVVVKWRHRAIVLFGVFVFPGRWAIPFRRIYSGAIQVWLKPVRPDQRSSIRETMGRNTSCWLHSWRQWKHYSWVTASGMTLILQDPSAVLTVRPVFWKITCSEIFVELYRLNVYVVEN